jgi:hypothetical protein
MVNLGQVSQARLELEAVVVHSNADVRRLRKIVVHDNERVVPHSVVEPDIVYRERVRGAIGGSDSQIVGTFGFLLLH